MTGTGKEGEVYRDGELPNLLVGTFSSGYSAPSGLASKLAVLSARTDHPFVKQVLAREHEDVNPLQHFADFQRAYGQILSGSRSARFSVIATQ